MNEQVCALQCVNVCKSFGQNIVLNQINLSVAKGSVHALLGQNGAGKSTLVKIITGVYTRDQGSILVDGKEAKLNSPRDAETLGISIIHQDHQMVPQFDVTRNAYLGSELKNRYGCLDLALMRSRVKEKLELIQADFSADTQISDLTVGQREQVAIVAALLRNPKILILDEPTASLSAKEIHRLFEIIGTLKNQGVTIIYISHHLDEVFSISDTITILRDSVVQGTMKTTELDHHQVVKMMIGKELREFFPKEQAAMGKPLLEVKGLKQGKLVKDVNFTLHEGEILGFAGLVGSGRTETMLSIYGAQRNVSGEISIDGKPYTPQSPLMARKTGIAFIPEDRRNEGIVADMTVAENMSLAYAPIMTRLGIMNRAKQTKICADLVDKLSIRCSGLKQRVRELSGGNQQKVVISRWLPGNAKIYIFDQPTTGVDVGAKTEIYKQMVGLAQKGCGVIFVSSENDELLGMCDSIIVMSKGSTVKQCRVEELSESQLLLLASGGE